MRELIEMVRLHFDAPVHYATSKSRLAKITWPRHALRYVLKRFTTLSLHEIGKLTGNANHATVMSSCDVVDDELGKDSVRADIVKNLIPKAERLLKSIRDGREKSITVLSDEDRKVLQTIADELHDIVDWHKVEKTQMREKELKSIRDKRVDLINTFDLNWVVR